MQHPWRDKVPEREVAGQGVMILGPLQGGSPRTEINPI